MYRLRLLRGFAAVSLLAGLIACAPAPTSAPAGAPTAVPTETAAPAEAPTVTAAAPEAAAANPTATPTLAVTTVPTAIIKTGAIGERLEAGGMALIVNEVTALEAIDETRPADGAVFVVLNVTIEAISHERTPINPFDFVLKLDNGLEINPVFTAPEPLIKNEYIKAGQKVSGNVSFVVPVGVEAVSVTFQPLVFGAGYEPIRVMLGR